MNLDTAGSAARARYARETHEANSVSKMVGDLDVERDTNIIDELIEQYKAASGKDIAPAEALRHMTRADEPIFGEESAASQESHTRDAIEMSKVAPSELATAMLFHDVGKSGPDHKDKLLSYFIPKMYAYNYPYRGREGNPAKTPIETFIKSMLGNLPEMSDRSAEDKESVAKVVTELLDIGEGATMRDFYDAHIQWGVQLQEKLPFIDKETAFTSFGHHILPGMFFRDYAYVKELQNVQEGIAKMPKTPEAKIPVMEEFAPKFENIKLAAGAQSLDYCNAVFTRRDKYAGDGTKERRIDLLQEACKETYDILTFEIDHGGYDTLIEEYGKKGVTITITDAEKQKIKDYINRVLVHYANQITAKIEKGDKI